MRMEQRYNKYDPEYYRIHHRIRKVLGKPSNCSNSECNYKNPKRFEWALIKGRGYSNNPDDYISLCPSCHRKYDYVEDTGKKMSASKKGKNHQLCMRYVMRLSDDDHYTYLDISRAAKENGISRTAIMNCLAGSALTAGGYKWRYRI